MAVQQVDPLVLARQNDPHRHDGDLAVCDRCGYMIRWIAIVTKEGNRSRMCVAPYPLRGNWGRALEGYGEGRKDKKEPEKTGPLWVLFQGVGHHWRNPPPTVEGYRAHWADCPGVERKTEPTHPTD